MEAALINAKKLTDTLPTELSVGVVSSDLNRNSAKLLMGSLFLNAPSMVFVIWKMLTCGLLAELAPENCCPSSVPASHGGDMVTCQLSRHLPLSHMSRLSTPTNQSGDGASIEINDTLEKFEVTWTLIPVSTPSAPVSLVRIRFQAFFAVIWSLISFTRVEVPPENEIYWKLCLNNRPSGCRPN